MDIQNVFAGYGARDVLRGVSFSLQAGENLAILGPNGCGKTTLLRVLAGLLPFRGEVRIGGRNLASLSPLALASQVGMMSQSTQAAFDYTVREVVRMGRYRLRRGGLFGGGDPQGEAAVERAMEAVALAELADRPVSALSGGQQQRVFLARVLAQEPAVILLDEPTNHLDLKNQIELMEYLRAYTASGEHRVIGVFHDLTLAPMLCRQALFMKDGVALAKGPFGEIATPAFLREIYGVDVRAHLSRALEALPGEEIE
ncbi:MAG: ABC transporter ATP-binding protein [Clostridia bacterium]|nr:ABC transporter ATP-binding protein [Clostridia bacterium]